MSRDTGSFSVLDLNPKLLFRNGDKPSTMSKITLDYTSYKIFQSMFDNAVLFKSYIVRENVMGHPVNLFAAVQL